MRLTQLFGLLAILAVLAIARDDRPELSLPRPAEFQYDPPAVGSYKLPVIKSAADGSVLNSEGRALSLKELTRGRVTVLSFIYTRCAGKRACPYATGVLNQVHAVSAKDTRLARSLRLVSLSFDPEHDTPEHLRAYSAWASSRADACEWQFVTTRSQRELGPILRDYGQAVDPASPGDPEGPLNHTLRVLLIDANGGIRNIYSADTLDPRLVITDIRTLLAE